MVSQAVLVGIIIVVFFVGVGTSFAVFSSGMWAGQSMFMGSMMNEPQTQQQWMNQMMKNSEFRTQMMQNMEEHDVYMHQMMDDPQFRMQMLNHIQEHMAENNDFREEMQNLMQQQMMNP